MSRIAARFAALKVANRKAFIPFISAGDPDLTIFAEILKGLPHAGADLIEIGMPFSDPVADGPAIERANLRAFAAGITLKKIIALVATFRQHDQDTPIILMGYANPVFSYGIDTFLSDAKAAGVDGLIIADLPPEEDAELRLPAAKHSIDIIRLVTPTTDATRLKTVLDGASGFLYYVSVTGITGSKQASADPVKKAVDQIRTQSALPVAVGFGITTPDQARAIAAVADAVVVGSAIVNRIAANLDAQNAAKPGLVNDVLAFVETLANATHGAQPNKRYSLLSIGE
jgi:tryptophan synthase alpha chain